MNEDIDNLVASYQGEKKDLSADSLKVMAMIDIRLAYHIGRFDGLKEAHDIYNPESKENA